MNTELWVDGTGQHVEIHEQTNDCMENGCCIHNPSDHVMREFPLYWRTAGPLDFKPSHMERLCPHGVGHPDPDALAYLRRTGKEALAKILAVHGCDGCCSEPTQLAESK